MAGGLMNLKTDKENVQTFKQIEYFSRALKGSTKAAPATPTWPLGSASSGLCPAPRVVRDCVDTG